MENLVYLSTVVNRTEGNKKVQGRLVEDDPLYLCFKRTEEVDLEMT